MESTRRIVANDWRLYRDIRLAALAESPDSFGSTLAREVAYADADWQARVLASAETPTQAIFVAQGDDAWLGMVGVYPDPEVEPDARLWGMWVAPAARGGLFAGELIATACEFAQSYGANGVRLNVLTTNERAVRLYARHGFATIATEPFPDTQRPGTDYVMRRPLP